MAIITNNDEKVEIVLEKRNLRSRKLENGRNKRAISIEKNNGAKTVLPIFAKYPIARMLMSIKASLSKKGSFKSVIIN